MSIDKYKVLLYNTIVKEVGSIHHFFGKSRHYNFLGGKIQ